jgi:hypothetical protein
MGNSLAARASIVVPLVGYFILFNSDVVDFLRLHSSICSGRACEVSWRLLMLYFGGSLYGLGGAVYGLFCPDVIKSFSNAADYLNAQSDYFSNRNNLLYLLDRLVKLGGTVPATIDREVNNRMLPGRIFIKHELAEVMGHYYIALNYSRYRARLICFVSFWLGLALISVPTVFTFAQVLLLAIQRMM